MYFSQTWQEILNWTRAFADIIIVWFILYYAIKIVRNNSRTIQIFKGIVLVLVVKSFANFFGLSTLGVLADMFVSYGFLAIIVIFQPEIRSLLERLGKSNMFSKISTLTGNEKEHLVDEVVKATMILSKEQTGALITLEQGQSLSDYIKTGTQMNSMVTTELLTAIFVTTTPLHDGAVIIQGDRLACASAYFPPTNLDLPNRYGARHRAAIGISEITDSVTIVVSEETGGISIAENGKIRSVDSKELREYLLRTLCNEETEMVKSKMRSADRKSFYVVEEPVEVITKGRNSAHVEEGELTSERVGLFGKLAVKKQNTQVPEKGSGLFGRKRKEDVMEKLANEEMNVKLPRKVKNERGKEAAETLEVKVPTVTNEKSLHEEETAKMDSTNSEDQVETATEFVRNLDGVVFEFSGTVEESLHLKATDDESKLSTLNARNTEEFINENELLMLDPTETSDSVEKKETEENKGGEQ